MSIAGTTGRISIRACWDVLLGIDRGRSYVALVITVDGVEFTI